MSIECRRVFPDCRRDTTFSGRIGIVVPAHDEARHLASLLDRCDAVDPAVIVVVDDASTDATPEVLDRIDRGRADDAPLLLFRNRRNLGKQGAVRRALRALVPWDLDGVALIDGDGQHDPAELPPLAAHLAGADLVIGARRRDRMPPQRRLSNRLVNAGFRGIAGTDFADIQSGLRLYRKAAADALASHLPVEGAYGLEYESLVVLALDARDRDADLRIAIAEVSCAYGAAASGIRARHVFDLGVGTLRQAARLRKARLSRATGAGRRWRNRAMTVEIHDVSAATMPQVERIRAALEGVGVDRGSLLVVPAWEDERGRRWPLRRDPAAAAWLRERRREGWEVVLHGLTHRAPQPPEDPLDAWLDRWWSRGQDEFARLDEPEARRRLREGREVLREAGVPPAGFVAPVWRQSPGTRLALRTLGFRFTADLGAVHLLTPAGPAVSSPALTFAAPDPVLDLGKRAAMLGAEVAGIGSSLLRVAVHPEDLRRDGLLEHIVGRVRRLLRHRRLVTYEEWLGERSRGAAGAA